MTDTARFALPLLSTGQAQKEVTHNEAVQALESMIQPLVEGGPTNAPPASSDIGSQYLVGQSPSGAWVERAGAIATWTSGGWRFVTPIEGLTACDRAAGHSWRYLSGNWQPGIMDALEVRVAGQKVVGERRNAIANPVGGATADLEARAAINAILDALRGHGLLAS